MARVLTDFHHSSLLRSTNLLFGDRLGMEVYRPIGMEWFDDGWWAINNLVDTAEQYLKIESQPLDGTPALNQPERLRAEVPPPGVFNVLDPGNDTTHRACTLDFFKHNQFDYVIASIPAHVALFERLVAQYQPDAKLIVQIGNEWPVGLFAGHNVLASVKPREYPANVQYYHQEFDLNVFQPSPTPTQPGNRNVYSFINILQNMPMGSQDFNLLQTLLPQNFKFKSFGGQCRDGNMDGPGELADKMREAMFIYHVKDGGDGFGHVLYNAFAVGRPVITRRRFYADRLGEELLAPGRFGVTCIDLDLYPTLSDAAREIKRLANSPAELVQLGLDAAQRFLEVVDYGREAEEIRTWLSGL